MIVFTFPGQGSQKPGMGGPWREHPAWSVVEEASELLGRDLAALLLDTGAEELTRTDNAQLATFLTSLVVLRAVTDAGLRPGAVAGHSLGEYTALVAAEVLTPADGLRLVAARGAAMLAATTARTGTMAAVLGLEDDEVAAACARCAGEVWVANLNAPGQVVIAGSPEGVAEATEVARELGAKKVMPMAVSGAFHTPFMAPAQEALASALAGAELREGTVPVIANVDALPHRSSTEWAALLDAQLCSPVRWRPSLEHLGAAGATVLLELGPGTVLTGMAKRTLDGVTTRSISTPEALADLTDLADLAAPERSPAP